MANNKAKDILIPKQPGIFRTVFLYVGQGEATLMMIPEGNDYRYVLIDSNKDEKNHGVDVIRLLKDLLENKKLDIFINTHPHVDHLGDIKLIHSSVGIKEVWHSGHTPGKDHNDAYLEMKKVIDDIGTSNEYILFGTNDRNKIRKSNKETEVIKKIGNINFQVFSPSEYVADDIADEKQDRRYQRIHEQCAVIRFSYGSSNESHIMITGDSDKKAWESHITNYHKKNLYSNILSASHHGSRTFFKESEDDENIYEEHYKNISPEYVVVSAPKQSESKHGHPHDDAINLYLKLIQKENILHLGKNLECAIVDINSFGELDITMDKALVEEYGFNIDKDSFSSKNVGIKTSQLDEKPMG